MNCVELIYYTWYIYTLLSNTSYPNMSASTVILGISIEKATEILIPYMPR